MMNITHKIIEISCNNSLYVIAKYEKTIETMISYDNDYYL